MRECHSPVTDSNIELVGWTADRFCSPSDLSSSLAVLTTLRNAINNGDCKWMKLSAEARRAHIKKWNEDVAAGKVIPKSRNARSDKGKKRKRSNVNDENQDPNEPSDGDNDDHEDSVTATSSATTSDPTPPEKRRKTSSAKVGAAPRMKKAAATTTAPRTRKAAAAAERSRNDESTRKALANLKARRSKVRSRAMIEDDESDRGGSREIGSSGASTPAGASTDAPADAPIDTSM
ncbi:hypothetical protein DFH09DRAFT_1311852 [Mycena vulgaris]|nr:hypothetical protein DFH09DRAFT_1311852 [Mycena vulgaris]